MLSVKNPLLQFGQIAKLSPTDALQLNALYDCKDCEYLYPRLSHTSYNSYCVRYERDGDDEIFIELVLDTVKPLVSNHIKCEDLKRSLTD